MCLCRLRIASVICNPHGAAAPGDSTANEMAGLPGPQHTHRVCTVYFVLVTLFAAGSALQLASVLESDGGPTMDGGFDSFIVIFAGATAALVLCRDNISRRCLRHASAPAWLVACAGSAYDTHHHRAGGQGKRDDPRAEIEMGNMRQDAPAL